MVWNPMIRQKLKCSKEFFLKRDVRFSTTWKSVTSTSWLHNNYKYILPNVYFIIVKNEFSISYAQACLNIVFAGDVKWGGWRLRSIVIKNTLKHTCRVCFFTSFSNHTSIIFGKISTNYKSVQQIVACNHSNAMTRPR